MDRGVQKLAFPAVAFSAAGWVKGAVEAQELTEADPTDDLADWQGLQIYDSSGSRYVARRAWRAWPKSDLGALACRLVSNAVHVDFELAGPEPVGLGELKEKVQLVCGAVEGLDRAKSHREVIELFL